MKQYGSEIPGEIYTFPTQAESEYAMRGPAVDRTWIMERMEERGVPRTFDGFVESATEDRGDRRGVRIPIWVENVVTEWGGRIITHLAGEGMRDLFDSGSPFSAWRVFGTNEGTIKPGENAWIRQNDATRADWGPPNGWRTGDGKGPLGMAGGIMEWLADFEGDYPDGGIHVNPTGPRSGVARLLGGGGHWQSVPDVARAAYFYHWDLDVMVALTIGFRGALVSRSWGLPTGDVH